MKQYNCKFELINPHTDRQLANHEAADSVTLKFSLASSGQPMKNFEDHHWVSVLGIGWHPNWNAYTQFDKNRYWNTPSILHRNHFIYFVMLLRKSE